jgi:hypothetical protein
VGSTPTFGTITKYAALPNADHTIGAWLSLVERSVRDAEVGGSNPLAPTIQKQLRQKLFLLSRPPVLCELVPPSAQSRDDQAIVARDDFS